MSKEKLIELIMGYFDTFNRALGRVINLLVEDPNTAYPTVMQVVNDIFNVLLATSYVLIVMFFFIDLSNKTFFLEIRNYEITAKLLFRFLLAKIIVENCRGLMMMFFTAFQDIISSVAMQGGSPLGQAAQDAILAEVYAMDGGLFGFNYIMYYISLLPSLLIVWGASIFASVIVIARFFEIMIYSAIAPLPLSALAGETTAGSARSFIQSYVSVCLQGVIIVIAFRIFGGIVGDAYSGHSDIFTFIVLSVVFVLTLVKSGTWARQIVGNL